MSLKTIAWKLASPYDAYVSHVARLNDALERLEYLSGQALGLEAGLRGSVRFVPGGNREDRAETLRARLDAAGAELSEEEFQTFLAHLGGGSNATVEEDRARTADRLSHTTRGMAEYFAIAAGELSILESRGYNPSRLDIARQLRENHLPATPADEYRHRLRELGARVSHTV